jgi:hypothetical protein
MTPSPDDLVSIFLLVLTCWIARTREEKGAILRSSSSLFFFLLAGRKNESLF